MSERDLVWFNFYVNRFIDSEDVQQMTAEEVGQYWLLLCHAWRLHRGATLPTDKQILQRIARGKVSPLVMKKFDLVDTPEGKRYRNARLYDEWVRATERMERYIEGGRNSWNKRQGTSEAASRQPQGSFEATDAVIQTNKQEVEKIQKAGREKRLKELESIGEDDE